MVSEQNNSGLARANDANDTAGSPSSAANPWARRLASLRSVGARFWAWVRKNADDIVSLSALSGLCLVVVLLHLDGISSGGDAILKWHFVRQWFYANDFSHAVWDHHMARLGVNGIAYLVQLVFGRGPNSYFIPSILATLADVVFLYACAKRLGGRGAAVVSAMLFIYFPETPIAASQLLPEVFSGSYALIATYFYLRYTDAVGKPRRAWLTATGLALFVAYLAKETSVFFLPGFAWAIWLAGKKFRDRARDVTLLGLVFGFGVLCETAFYRFFTKYAHRFAVVVVEHVPGPDAVVAQFTDLFHRFTRLGPPWQLAFYSFLATSIGLFGFSKDRRTSGILAIITTYFFLLTFLIRRLHPITLWHNFHERYFDPTAPFVALVTGLFLSLAFHEAWKRYEDGKLGRFMARLERFGAVLVLGLSLVAGFISYTAARPDLDKNALKRTAELADIATDTYRRNLPIVSVGMDRRGVWVVYAVLLDDRLLERARFLPSYDEVKLGDYRHDYLVRYPSIYSDAKVAQMVHAGCALDIRTHGGLEITMQPMKKLPESCDDEREALSQ